VKTACIATQAALKMLPSRQILARSEDRNVVKCKQARFSGLVWTGQNLLQGATAYFTPASPLKRVFYWARFDLTARMRQQVRYPCSDVCLNLKQANQTKSSSDCAHCQLVCEATTGRPSRLHGVVALQGEGTRVPNSLTGYCRKAVTGGYLHREKGLTLSGENK
jgi:hypothetical protein